MNDDHVLDIADLCLAIDKKAFLMYSRIADSSSDPELRTLWREMAEAEKGHITFWDSVKTTAAEHPLPDIFDDPAQVQNELEQLLFKIAEPSERWEVSRSLGDAFVLAFRLEFAMAHQAFAMFYQTLGQLAGAANPQYDYDLHLNQFIHMAARCGKELPALELLGEALQKEWRTNQAMTQFVLLDALTGLLNRRGFAIFAKQMSYLAQRTREHVAVLIVELDDWQGIIDRHGHPKGDQVLKGIADVLRGNLRRSDVVGRYSGTEFSILLPGIQANVLQRLAEQLLYQIGIAKPGNVQVTVSICAAQGQIRFTPDTELEPLIAKAARCLTSAKAGGKNRVVYSE